jgi:hypothetical protein
MRLRPFLAVAAAAALVATIPAHAATPTLDGKKTKTLTFTGKSTPQSNDAAIAADQGAPVPNTRPNDYAHCPATRCLTWSFVYKPAKGVRYGPFSVKISWTVPVQDYDIYVIDTKYGQVGSCGAAVGTAEYALVDAPVPGHRYLVVVDEYRAVPDTVTATVSFPAKPFKPLVAGAPDSVSILPFACGIPA